MNFLYVANWKMNMSPHASFLFVDNNYQSLLTLSRDNRLIICPSFVSIDSIAKQLKDTSIAVGAQDCSQYTTGAYTGQVSASYLKEVGVSYCIIGHIEQRHYFQETDTITALKMENTLIAGIIPIICVSTQQNISLEKMKEELTHQLSPIKLVALKHALSSIIIAYEPVSAIGTGLVPNNECVENVFDFIKESMFLPFCTIKLLYGGSVTHENSSILKKISGLNGFLIGSASTNFQMLQKIVL